jgi:pimeloyl-ACP methyl ester carboxylesterase
LIKSIGIFDCSILEEACNVRLIIYYSKGCTEMKFDMRIPQIFLIAIILVSTVYMDIANAAMNEPFFQAKQSRYISYVEAGQGPPLILIHAFPTDKRLWSAQLEGLKNSFHVIAIDLLGFGQSIPVDGKAIAMSDYADEVKGLIDQLRIPKAIIGGESMGGYIALSFFEKYPNAVLGLVLSDTQAIPDSDITKAKRETMARFVLEHGTAQLIADFMPKALTSEAPATTHQFLQNILESQPASAMASSLRGMALRKDYSNLLANTSLPILILAGDQDGLISPQQSEHMHQLAKNSKFKIIKQAAHLSSLEQPQQWNQAVTDMFSTQ